MSLFEITGRMVELMDLIDDPESEVDEQALIEVLEFEREGGKHNPDNATVSFSTETKSQGSHKDLFRAEL